MIPDHVRDQLEAEISVEQYERIKALWKKHSISEDQRSIEGLLSTLSETCEYLVLPAGDKWVGKSGAAQFYTEVLSAFPDIKFELQNIVIGPQGVYESAEATGTLMGTWKGWKGQGEKVKFNIDIFFPWVFGEERFGGETVQLDYNRILAEHGVRRS